MTDQEQYDVIIVGAGISGAILAKQLAAAKKRVLILESGPRDRKDRTGFHDAYLSSVAKLPNTPYPPYPPNQLEPENQAIPRAMTAMTFAWPALSDWKKDRKNPDQYAAFNKQSYMTYRHDSEIPFLSSYERMAGGTTWHWLGTAVRLVPNDFSMKSTYGVLRDWPLEFSELFDDYAAAEDELGVSASIDQQLAVERYLGQQFPAGYEYPMETMKMSVSDKVLNDGMKGMQVDGQDLEMTCTPQAKNSKYRKGRPACEGNSSCIPICPIQAKYDATVTLREAEQSGYVKTQVQTVVTGLEVGDNGRISSVNYKIWQGEPGNYHTSEGSATAPIVVLAAHAIETVKILQMSRNRQGIANSSDQVGRNLMDHLCYLGWGLSDVQNFPYRGPRSGSGIESLRDGPFRNHRAAWRVDVGNVGWEWADDDPNTSLKDFVNGTNNSRLNPDGEKLFGAELVNRLNYFNTRMMRLCYLVEQEPQATNRITLSDSYTDALGLPRPEVTYSVTTSDYTLNGIVAAAETTDRIFQQIGKGFAKQGINPNFSRFLDMTGFPGIEFSRDGKDHKVNLFGAGHIIGTYRMGSCASEGVVNSDMKSWDHDNLYLLGSGTFPTEGTGNPTLTLVALTYRASRAILKDLGSTV